MIQAFRPHTSFNMTAGAATSVSGTAVPVGCMVVRVVATDQPFLVATGPTPVASATSTLVPTNQPAHFLVQPGDKVAVIRAGGTDASVNVTYLSR